MSLSAKQAEFTRDWAVFLPYAILWADRHGYRLVMEETYRHPTATHGHPNSTHRMKLAGHVLLLDNGELVSDSEVYAPLGQRWENIHPDNRWGGRFSSPDGCHFSRTHNGIS